MKPVFIRWVDSGRWDGWTSPDSALDAASETSMICESVAWLVGQTEEWVLISSSRNKDAEVLSALQIPRVSIKYIKELNIGVQADQDQAFQEGDVHGCRQEGWQERSGGGFGGAE